MRSAVVAVTTVWSSSLVANTHLPSGFAAGIERLLMVMEKNLDYSDRSMKAQMREANRCGAASVLIVGETEMARKTAVLKNMTDGTQTELPFEQIPSHFSGITA
jgi:threonyl-tRNA synthetase